MEANLDVPPFSSSNNAVFSFASIRLLNPNEVLLQIGNLIVHIKSNRYWLRLQINQRNRFQSLRPEPNNSEVNILILSFFKLQFEWNTLSRDSHVDLVQIIYIKSDDLVVLDRFPRREHNRHLQHVKLLGFDQPALVLGGLDLQRQNNLSRG